jgi:DNA-binding transcriptional ArsR family regulator
VLTNQAAPQLDALGDPTRRAIFERLANGPLAVVDIARALPISRPGVSQHLKILKDAHLVTDRAEGTRRVYQLDPHGLALVSRYFDTFWSDALDEFRRFAEQSHQLEEVRKVPKRTKSPKEKRK